jgi:hypothetical protein
MFLKCFATATLALLAQGHAQAAAASAPAEIIQGMRTSQGLLTVARHEGKAVALIPKTLLDRPIWVSSNLRKGVGSSWLYANAQGPSWIARFRLTPSGLVQLIAANPWPKTPDPEGEQTDPAYAKLAQASYAESLLGSWPARAIDADWVAIDANALALGDLGAWGAKLEAAGQAPYLLDLNNSEISQISNSPEQTVFAARQHFFSPKAALAPKNASLADGRSALIETALAFSSLPSPPMKSRAVDERVGLFKAARIDLEPSANPRARVGLAARWRLEKSHPEQASSPPKRPIRFEICPEMPAKYRQAVKDGALAWNQAFEDIGFQNAIEVHTLDDDEGIVAGGRRAVICFAAADDLDSAYGLTKVDPRSGEILEAHVLIPEIFMSLARFDFDQGKPKPAPGPGPGEPRHGEFEGFSQAWSSAPWAWDAKGREAIADEQLRALVVHEVGHALGLRHNFKGSSAYPFSRLSAADYKGPLSSSVMDYLPMNAYPGRALWEGTSIQTQPGAYDRWAIAYAYSQYPTEAAEEAGLAALLALAHKNPELAYATDDDAQGERAYDPTASKFDLGSNPLEFAKSRFAFARAGLQEMDQKAKAGELDPGQARYALERLFGAVSRPLSGIHRFLGGATLTRQQGSSPAPALATLDPATQRQALALLSEEVFADYLQVPPAVLARAVAPEAFRGSANPSFDLENKIDEIQNSMLKPFFTPIFTDRVMDAQRLWTSGPAPLDLRAVENGVKDAVWRELRLGRPTTRQRRNLQRAYVDMLCAAVKTPGLLSADPRALFREFAQEIKTLAAKEARSARRDAQEKSHLRDIQASLDAALTWKPGP